jgi:hypothetical protein
VLLLQELQSYSKSWDCFEENGSASLRHLLLAMTVETAVNSFSMKGRDIHEQVPNTNIKFICPEFKEKILFKKGRWFMNFGPTPTSK